MWTSEAPGGHPALLRARLAARARAAPDAVAVEDDAGVLTLGELHRRVDALAQVLLAAGAGPEWTVAVRGRRDRALVTALLAVVWSGAAFVAVDPDHPARRQRAIVRDCDARVVVTGGAEPVPELDRPVVPAHARPAPTASRRPLPPIHPEQPAYVMYTSGSTGAPKGVVVSQRAFAAYLDWATATYFRGGYAAVQSSPAFDLTLTGLFVPLLGGGAVRLVAGSGPEALAAALAGRAWALLKLTPSHLDALGTVWSVARPGATDVEVMVVGGEALRRDQVAPWLSGPRPARVVNEYGPTEATVGCCVHRAGPTDPPAVPIGVPVPYASATVVAAGRPAGPGEAGELVIGGAGLARGYLHRPGDTADRFTPDPDSRGGRRYRTGDIASRDARGVLHFHGRGDRQLKIRGHRVEPGEVEWVLRRAPGVRAAVVVGEPAGGATRLVAYLVPDPGVALDRMALRAHVARRLPEYAVPGRVVVVPAIPLTHNGKVDHERLGTAAVAAALERVDALGETAAGELVRGLRPSGPAARG